MLDSAAEFIKNLGKEGKVVLFVGTKPEAKEITKNAAESLNMPYVTERWIGAAVFGAVRVAGGAENVREPRLPPEKPPPGRA